MESDLKQFIERIHAAPHKVVVALTGGGVSAVANLLAVPGGSRTILETIIPYDERSLVDFLGRRPEQFCSEVTSRDLARRAWDRAGWLLAADKNVCPTVGLGCTASLVSDRPKRGPHRLHVSWHTATHGVTHSLTLMKGARDRWGEEQLAGAIVLNALAEAFEIPERMPLALLAGEELQTEQQANGILADFFVGKLDRVLVRMDGQVATSTNVFSPTALVPGSFNPLHEGHLKLAEIAGRLCNMPVAFELSIENVDKPALGAEEVQRRRAQFAWRAPLWLTRAPTFLQKARLFPGATFVVGFDTAERILSHRYYEAGEIGLHAALAEMQQRGCRFLVAGRAAADGRFCTIADLPIPATFREQFTGIEREQFAVNISSTELRRQGNL